MIVIKSLDVNTASSCHQQAGGLSGEFVAACRVKDILRRKVERRMPDT